MSGEQRGIVGDHPIVRVIGYLDRHAPFPIGSLLLGLLSGAYLANPTLGVFELVPDNLPFVGNLDEGAAGIFLAWSVSSLVRWWRVRRAQRRARLAEKEER